MNHPPTPRSEQAGTRHLALAAASLLVGLSLFFPRPVNVSPLGAFGLYAGAYAATRTGWIYPLTALGVCVVALGGYHGLVLATVFLGFAGPAVIAALWLRGRVRPVRLVTSALGASVWFFLVSNLGSWLVFGVARGESLMQHYALGVPYFRNTVAGDLVFTGVLFGLHAWAFGRGRRAARRRDAGLGARTAAGRP